MNKRLTYLLLILLLLGQTAVAEQLSFKKMAQGDQTRFKYTWQDSDGNIHQLDFTLANQAIFNRFRQYRAYKPSRAQDAMLMALKKAAAPLDKRKIAVDFVKRIDGISIELRSKDQLLLDNTNQMLQKVREASQAKQLKNAYYNVLVDHLGQDGLKPDHVRFAQESLSDVTVITNAMRAANPQLRGRKMAQYILSFVQSIPYASLESRITTNASGFNPPLRLINNNQGDCDSKVTLMAALLNAIYPQIKIVIIYIPQHALIGVQLTHRKQDKWIKIKDRKYILSEPTGPALLPFAEVAKSAEFYIDSAQFSYEIF